MSWLSKSGFWFFLFFVWFGVLWYFSSRSQLPEVGPELPNFDKMMHAGYFFGGGILLTLGVKNHRRWEGTPLKTLFWVVTVSILLVGMLDEFHQTFTAGRSGNDLGDLIADMIGGGLGAIVGYKIQPILRRLSQV